MRFPVPARSASLLLLSVAALPSFGATAPAFDQDLATRRIQAHTVFLSDDLMEGRGTGTRGYAMAARYIESQFARIGLEPGANGGKYEQPVKFLESAADIEAGRFVIKHEGKETALVAINDMLAFAAPGQAEAEIAAGAVFVGFGVQAPEFGYDDFAGVDLRGKIAVIVSGAPEKFPSEPRAHYSSGSEKNALLVQHGAIGVITVQNPLDEARYPWPRVVAGSRFPGMRLVATDGSLVDAFTELKVRGAIPSARLGQLLAGSGQTAEEVLARAARGEAKSFPLAVTVTLAGKAKLRPVECRNVLGWLPGTDPALAGEPIVITGHLDHLGVAAPIDGDGIYNGAMDNAIGLGIILAIAEDLAARPRLPRPILFAALTAEEKGLLGAFQLARFPPDRVRHFAANLNIDMTLFMAPVRDIVAWGAEHTTLGESVNQAAKKTGFTVSPDWMPEETIFVRSDQYPFVRTGVPAIYLGTGQHSTDPQVDLAKAWNVWLRDRYHKPNDDLNQPIDWPSTGAYTALMTELARSVATDPKAPEWLPDDFFGTRFAKRK